MRILGCWAIALWLIGTPASAQLFHPETATLENGLQVVVLPNHRAPVVMHMLWFKVGAIDEVWGKSGIAHFLEHLMFKGTPKHPEGEYSRLISGMGGRENAFTSYDYTSYHAMVGKDNLSQIMALEADRFQNWRVTDEQVVRERDVVLKERQQITENNPVAAFFEEVNAILYPNHPYQRPVIGWRNEIEALNRKDAMDFVQRYYVPENAILVISGDVTLQDVLPLAKKYYGVLSKRDVLPRDIPQVAELNAKRVIEKQSPLVREVVWSRHKLVAPARADNIVQSDAMTVLQKIMGDSRIGRLYRRLVVQEQIATNAYIAFNPVSFGPAKFSIVVVPKPDVELHVIDTVIDDEIKKLVQHGVTEDEVKNAVQAMEIESVYARDSVSAPAYIVGAALAVGLTLDIIEDAPNRIKIITADHVKQAIATLFDEQDSWVTAIIKPEIKSLEKHQEAQ